MSSVMVMCAQSRSGSVEPVGVLILFTSENPVHVPDEYLVYLVRTYGLAVIAYGVGVAARFDLLDSIPLGNDPATFVKDDILEFNRMVPGSSNCRLVRDGKRRSARARCS